MQKHSNSRCHEQHAVRAGEGGEGGGGSSLTPPCYRWGRRINPRPEAAKPRSLPGQINKEPSGDASDVVHGATGLGVRGLRV